MTRPVITALPPAPVRGEDAATFAAKANTFVAALPAYGTESNALGVFMENEADAAEASRIAAEAAETGAEAAETAAQLAQAAAESASNATEWVSGQPYVEGDVVWSPINYLSYRANTNTSGTTDPSLSASWTSLNVPLPVSVANGGTGATTLTGVLRGNGTSAVTAGNVSLASEVTGTLPVANGGTGITSLGSGVATFLGTPSSANLAAAVTDETGSGALVFATSPTLVTPVLGTPQSGTLTNATGLPIVAGTTGTLSVARGGTGLTTLTANNVILGNGTSTPSFVAPSTSGNVLTSNGTTWTSAAAPSSGFTLGTPVATTSGTSITFTGIPSGVKQIVISFKQVSTNGTSYKWIRLGTSAGLQINTGYENNALRLKAATAIEGINASGGFAIYSQGATNWMSGSVVLTLENSSSNTWAAFGLLGDNYNGHTFTVAGAVSLSGVLDRVSFSAENGTDTFDEGEMNIAYI